MNEEEKKAIAEIYSIVYHDRDKSFVIVSRIKLNIILNLLFNQQKEIERQAKEIARQDRNIHKLNLDKIQQQKEIEEISSEELNTIINCIDRHYISKDRIREKIYELKKDIEIHSIYEENWNKINVLKELLEE